MKTPNLPVPGFMFLVQIALNYRIFPQTDRQTSELHCHRSVGWPSTPNMEISRDFSALHLFSFPFLFTKNFQGHVTAIVEVYFGILSTKDRRKLWFFLILDKVNMTFGIFTFTFWRQSYCLRQIEFDSWSHRPLTSLSDRRNFLFGIIFFEN